MKRFTSNRAFFTNRPLFYGHVKRKNFLFQDRKDVKVEAFHSTGLPDEAIKFIKDSSNE